MRTRAYTHTHTHTHTYTHKHTHTMMMVAFITSNSSLVPWIEGLCSSNPCGFEFSVPRLRSQLLFFLSGICSRKKAVSPGSQASRLPAYIYTCVHYKSIHIHTCRDLVHLDSLKCLVTTPGLTSENPTCSLCVCVCIHPLSPPSKNEKKIQTKPLSFFMSKNHVPRQQQVPCID